MRKIKNCLTIFFCVISCSYAFSQEKLIKDIDFDNIRDTIYLDTKKAVIVCQLSSKSFKKIKSKAIEILNRNSGIVKTKNGFEFQNNWMRGGYANQFRYDKNAKRIRLIGMSGYAYSSGGDGGSNSSVNLLTNDYIGYWNYYDRAKNVLIKMPPIKTKMQFKKIYLEDFNEETYFSYADSAEKLRAQREEIYVKTH